MTSQQLKHPRHIVLVVLSSMVLLDCVGPDHMTEEEMHETTLTCEQMFGPEKCE